MAMLKAFFDLSRTEVQSGVFVIGGYVEREAFWTDFEGRWLANLVDWKIEDFHLTEILAGRSKHGQFLGEHCAISFGKLIEATKPFGIWSGLIENEWRAMKAGNAFRNRYPSPYQFCFEDIIWQLSRWGQMHVPGEHIAPVFDDDVPSGAVRPLYEGYKNSPLHPNIIGSLTFGSRGLYVPLQAADVFAGETQRHWFDREFPRQAAAHPFPEFRNLFMATIPRGTPTGGLWTPLTLARAVDAFDRTGDPFNWAAAVSLPGRSS
jgi:hypothetical protein